MPTTCIKRGLDLIEKDASKVLGLKIGGNVVTTPGMYVPKAQAQSPPELTFAVPSGSPEMTYMVVAIDPDAPFPQFSPLGPVLHWIQPGLKAVPSPEGGPSRLESAEPFVANYIAPAPPIPLGGPHRYIFFLYEQPAAFEPKMFAPAEGKTMGNGPRIRWDPDGFEKKVGLGPILACNYFKSN